MSYQVIARKWRPQSFTELVGQDAISQTLLNALRSDRLPHALLFTGPRGTGKTSSARILAKSLRCPNSMQNNWVPCQVCDTCVEVSQGRNVDVIEIDGASNNGVEAIRELRETVGYLPSSGQYKIYIIDEVHMLSISAFNALLKTLEEPPAHVVFIMATTEAHKIPQTILSRCQRFDFRRIAVRQIQEHLQKICTQESIQADNDALWLIARQGDGSMRDSQSLLEQVITFSQKELSHKKVMEILGLTDRQIIYDTLDSVLNRDPNAIIQVLERYHLAALEPHLLAQDLMESIRHLTVVKVAKNASPTILDLPDSELNWLLSKTANISQEELHFLFDITLKGVEDIMKASDPRLVLEMVLLRLAAAPKISSLNELLKGIPQGGGATITPGATQAHSHKAPNSQSVTPSTQSQRQSVGATSASTSSPTPTAQKSEATPSEFSPTNNSQTQIQAQEQEQPQTQVQFQLPFPNNLSPDEKWLKTVEYIKQKDILVGSKLEGLSFLGLKENSIQLGVPLKMQFLRQQMQDSTQNKKLKSFIDQTWGTEYVFDIVVIKDKTQGLSAIEAVEQKKQQESDKFKQSVLENSIIKTTQDVFNVQIVNIKDLDQPPKPQSL